MAEKNLKALEKKCMCKDCPSFLECKEKTAFCLFGKSKCIKKMNGCICGGCPVHAELSLKSGYYCLKGKE
ncbi:MAG: DUF2769 domain-containing protein [Nanoarchaeota archaeon]